MKKTLVSKQMRCAVACVSLLCAAALASCAQTKPFINKSVKSELDFRDTAAHRFASVNIDEKEGQLVVYGKVDHRHAYCKGEGHVDLAVVAKDNSVRHQTGIVLKRGSNRVRGWYGAAFRTRVALKLNEGDKIQLAFHDDGCFASETFACESNAAVEVVD